MSSDKISIFGLGYVGGTTAICMSKLGYIVYGVDIDPKKNKLFKNKIKVSTFEEAINNTDISFICLPTPCKKNGDVDLSYVEHICKQIRLYDKNQIIVIRSTVFPKQLIKLEKILKINWAVNPEFLREATAIQDFLNPPYIIVGSRDKKISMKVMNCYKKIKAKKIIVSPEMAQMIKYINNVWHACKVSFTNEVGDVCKEFKINGDELMNLFCEDTKLNISTNYHKIGGPYGGHCLPKDLSVLQYNLNKKRYPLIHSISKSNEVKRK